MRFCLTSSLDVLTLIWCCSRAEQAVASISSACDLVKAVVLGQAIPKKGMSISHRGLTKNSSAGF